MTNARERYSLAELTEAADVSVRTVRYYISEGLLPPPVGSGPKSYYTRSHLDRLRAIGRMRAHYLPLREIRRRLGAMSEEQIRAVALEEPAEAEEVAESADDPMEARLAEARAIFDAEAFEEAPRAPVASFRPAAGAWPMVQASASPSAAIADTHVENPIETETETWHRFKLGDEAELLIRASLWRRRRDRVEWLIDWARRVFR
jgi:DNA-binding transcriptional MerR regulator